MCFGNLRGIREAGKIFALPTYLFSGSVILMVVVGIVREALGNLPQQNINALHGLYTIGPGASSFTSLVIIFTLLKAFANGGASLTGIEAVSNAVSAFKPPEGLNARRVLVTEGLILGTLVAGISWLAHLTHAAPYKLGFPTVISQEANMVFGSAGHFMFWVVQAATALILYTGGNTSFNGFPFLTSFVAEDSFLPRWLMKRGQRLVFSNGIIVLTVLSVTADRGRRRQRERARPVLRDRRVHRRSPWPDSAWRSTTARTRDQAGGTSWSSASRPGCSPRSW